jgi:hypothetical protein
MRRGPGPRSQAQGKGFRLKTNLVNRGVRRVIVPVDSLKNLGFPNISSRLGRLVGKKGDLTDVLTLAPLISCHVFVAVGKASEEALISSFFLSFVAGFKKLQADGRMLGFRTLKMTIYAFVRYSRDSASHH